ncbi:MAG: phosphomannomutase/phosphoglucomutase [Porticoccaceae bacterium]
MSQEFAKQVFRGNDIRGDAETELTNQFAAAFGSAFARRVLALGEHTLMICRDARHSSPRLHSALVSALASKGLEVQDLGIGPTPLLGFALATSEAVHSGIMITASHNPKHQNGLKCVLGGKPLYGDDLAAIREEMQLEKHPAAAAVPVHFIPGYLDALKADIPSLSGLKIVIDGANGAAGPLAIQALEYLGAEVIPQFCHPDGDFPNRSPDTSNPENLTELCQRVLKEGANAGIGLDGDGDRMVAVTEQGRLLDADDLICLFSRQLLATKPGAGIVFDVKCSSKIAEDITNLGGKPMMERAGRSFIQTRLMETGAAMGAEYSAHYFFADRWFGTDDGIYAACRLLEICKQSGQSLEQLCPPVSGKVATGEIYLPVAEDKKFGIVDELLKREAFDIKDESPEIITTDGLRLEYIQGWALVRASNTSAALTLRFEAFSEAFLAELKDKVCQMLDALPIDIDTDRVQSSYQELG